MKKIFAIILVFVLMLTTASCSWWFVTPIEDDRLPDPLEGVGDGGTDTNSDEDTTDKKGLPLPDDVEGFAYLGGGLQFYHATTGDCVVVYNDTGAWVFDYMLREVTPLVDYDAMLAVADPTGRGAEYFGDVTLSVGCETIEDREIRVVLTVKSNTHDAKYGVAVYYTLNEPIYMYSRGDVRGYYRDFAIYYPGYDEPVVIDDIADWGRLHSYTDGSDYKEHWLYQTVNSFLTLDIESLEAAMGVASGTLKSWEDAVISDYKIIRYDVDALYFSEVYVEFTLAEGSLGRWHSDWNDGRYQVTVNDGPGQFMRILPVGEAEQEPDAFASKSFVETWVSHRGGWYPIEEQVVENGGYMHHLIDLYLGLNNFENADYEEFIEFCESTFGLENVADFVARDEVENHGGHGGSTALCDGELVASSGNDYVFEVTFWADVTETVTARYYEIHLTDRGDGEYTVERVECTLNNGFEVYTWSM